MPCREERSAENQYRFNDANNRLRELVEQRVGPNQRIPFLCECADDGCFDTVGLELSEYAELHENSDVFVIVPGHPLVDGEAVLRREERFEQVEKHDS